MTTAEKADQSALTEILGMRPKSAFIFASTLKQDGLEIFPAERIVGWLLSGQW
jgi:hypothetical protein